MRIPRYPGVEEQEQIRGQIMVSETTAIVDYEAQARQFLEKAQEYLREGELHQASEKGWGAASHMAKAVALSQGWSYDTHAEFSVVINNATLVTGDDSLRGLRGLANDLHGNFYRRHRHLDPEMIARDLASMAELVELLAPLVEVESE